MLKVDSATLYKLRNAYLLAPNQAERKIIADQLSAIYYPETRGLCPGAYANKMIVEGAEPEPGWLDKISDGLSFLQNNPYVAAAGFALSVISSLQMNGKLDDILRELGKINAKLDRIISILETMPQYIRRVVITENEKLIKGELASKLGAYAQVVMDFEAKAITQEQFLGRVSLVREELRFLSERVSLYTLAADLLAATFFHEIWILVDLKKRVPTIDSDQLATERCKWYNALVFELGLRFELINMHDRALKFKEDALGRVRAGQISNSTEPTVSFDWRNSQAFGGYNVTEEGVILTTNIYYIGFTKTGMTQNDISGDPDAQNMVRQIAASLLVVPPLGEENTDIEARMNANKVKALIDSIKNEAVIQAQLTLLSNCNEMCTQIINRGLKFPPRSDTTPALG